MEIPRGPIARFIPCAWLRRASHFACAVGWMAAFGAAPHLAFADNAPPPAERAHHYSPYEQQTIDTVLAPLGEIPDPAPEGKTIERVDVVPLDVVEPRDPLPRWLNVFHATSRRSVIARELLLRDGEPYQQVLADETIRNLRRLPQLSAILVVATKGSAPDRVGVVVITKDVWSLRLNWDLELTPGGVELFEVQPAEWNLAGSHQTLSGLFALQPSSLSFGLGYTIPRIDTSRLALVTGANLYVNRASGAPEGSAGSMVAGQPLFSARSEWAWDATVSWQDYIARRYVNAQLSAYADPATGQTVPVQWRSRETELNYAVTRSFGLENKHDFTFAAELLQDQYRTNFAGASARTVADFEAYYVPVADTRVGPWIRYHAYSQRYVRVFDFDTLALQEDYRLGHDVVLLAYPTPRAFGSTRDLVELYGAAQYTFAVRDGLFRAAVESRTDHAAVSDVVYAAFEPTAHFVSPTIGNLGRIVVDGSLLYRWRNYLNIQDYLGGDTRLRGYPTNFFVGQNVVSYNVEFRSRPIEIFTCQLAGVAFFDAGDAWRTAATFMPYQSVGLGLRALFPQLDREVFRADLGFPMERPADPVTGAIAPFAFFISFDQAFDTPSVSPAPVLPTGE